MSLATYENPSLMELALGDGQVSALHQGAALGELNAEDWTHWQRHLARRKHPRPLAKLTNCAGLSPLAWSLPDGLATGKTGQLIEQLRLIPKKSPSAETFAFDDELRDWLAGLRASEPDARLGLESLAWCHALPQVSRWVAAPQWCKLAIALIGLASDAAMLPLEAQPLAHQLLAGELPLTLAYILPEVASCRDLLEPASRNIAAGLEALLDGEGLPHGSCLALARPLLASWTRAALLAETMGERFPDDSRAQYQWFIRESLRLCRPDGQQMLAGEAGAWCKELFHAALAVSRDPSNRAIAEFVLPSGKSRTAKKRRRLPAASVNSEWAELAVLRSAWTPDAPRLAVNYSRGRMETELTAGRQVIWSGPCEAKVCVGQRWLPAPSAWKEQCWHSDADVDYLELEAELATGWKIQRQFVLAREDLFLLVSDAVIGPQSDMLRYECTWPLAAELRCAGAAATAEVAITGHKLAAVVLPLALAEWRCDGRSGGTLRQTDSGMQHTLARSGQRLYAPLFIDLHRGRAKKESTWRQLTVGADLRPQPHDAAVGYRVQIGSQQWLIYRSLAPPANRTVLGQNTVRDFLCARFNRKGEVESLVEIE